ncbi:MAG TPA: hypothetical protein PKC24_15735 [Cyclobacteriaceae bacterium]|nr:hypothetical protein [Cyclobacteriaceae bacterium]
MSNKTRSILKAIAVLMVLLAVLMEMGWVVIPAIAGFKLWIVIAAFGILLISSR